MVVGTDLYSGGRKMVGTVGSVDSVGSEYETERLLVGSVDGTNPGTETESKVQGQGDSRDNGQGQGGIEYKGKHSLRIIDTTGDTKLMWSAENQDEVASASRTFRELKAKGYNAFAVGKEGKPAGKVDSFDGTMEAIIMVPPMKGG